MEKEEILELFRITDERIAQIHADTEAKIAAIRARAEEEKRQHNEKIAKIQSQTEELKQKTEELRQKTEKLRQRSEEERIQNEKRIERLRAKREEQTIKMERSIQRISDHLGSYTKSVADIAEEYFYRCLKGNPYLGDIQFNEVLWDEKYDGKQYDIIMRNGQYIALVSVKTTIRERAINNLVKLDLPALRTFYSPNEHYKHVKFIGAVAGLTCKPKALEKANKNGILVMTQSEDKRAKIINTQITPKLF